MVVPTGASESCYGAPKELVMGALRLLPMEAPNELLLEALRELLSGPHNCNKTKIKLK